MLFFFRRFLLNNNHNAGGQSASIDLLCLFLQEIHIIYWHYVTDQMDNSTFRKCWRSIMTSLQTCRNVESEADRCTPYRNLVENEGKYSVVAHLGRTTVKRGIGSQP